MCSLRGRVRERLQTLLRPHESGQRFEILVATMLGVAALATAFSAYQASLDDGDSIQQYNRAVALTDKASQAYNEGTQELLQDEQIFLEFVKATQTDDEALAEYVQTSLMSDNLKKGVAWWADQPDNDKYPTPFTEDNPDYNIEAYARAADLDQQAEEAFDKGGSADERGDRYTLVTVILAAALFLLGVAAVARAWIIKYGFVAIGGIFLIGSIVQIGRIYWG